MFTIKGSVIKYCHYVFSYLLSYYINKNKTKQNKHTAIKKYNITGHFARISVSWRQKLPFAIILKGIHDIAAWRYVRTTRELREIHLTATLFIPLPSSVNN